MPRLRGGAKSQPLGIVVHPDLLQNMKSRTLLIRRNRLIKLDLGLPDVNFSKVTAAMIWFFDGHADKELRKQVIAVLGDTTEENLHNGETFEDKTQELLNLVVMAYEASEFEQP